MLYLVLFLQNSNCTTFMLNEIEITNDYWDIITKLYLRVYRGPNAEFDLKKQLFEYNVVPKKMLISKGRFVRYLSRGFVNNDLKRGGWVINSNPISIYLQFSKRKWKISRKDNFIFVRKERIEERIEAHNTKYNYHKKSNLRLLAEEMLFQDKKKRLPPQISTIRNLQLVQHNQPEKQTTQNTHKLKVNFKE